MNANYSIFKRQTNALQLHTYSFYREVNGSWYVDFPEYINQGYGTKANLEMVAGADALLDHLAPDGNITITFSNGPLEDADFHLRRILVDPWGATYLINEFLFRPVWLCNVSKFIFKGTHPKSIYIKKKK